MWGRIFLDIDGNFGGELVINDKRSTSLGYNEHELPTIWYLKRGHHNKDNPVTYKKVRRRLEQRQVEVK